jgi:6-pyruvoyltetrahydropterin/6-carboxytetrahydropterin synthase
MFRLTREVRFAVNPHSEQRQDRPSNSYAGYPTMTGLGSHFALQVTVHGEVDTNSQYLINIKAIDEAVRLKVVGFISDCVRMRRQNTAALVGSLFELLLPGWSGPELESVRLMLSPFLSVSAHAGELPMTRLSQKFEFSASHRLHNPALSEERNREIFGKCNNPHGHGHNYEVQVTLRGEPDENGVLADVPEFERIVAETVIQRFDHKHLNTELPEFRQTIPSVENIARVIYGLLRPKFDGARGKLASVTVWETPKTWCEYAED